MSIEKEQFLKKFSQHVLDERVSLFLGAGGSCDAGYPTWNELFKPFAEELGIPINESTDYYKLAQYYSNKYGTSELRKKINETLNLNEHRSPLLKELTDIGFENIWTTNFDNTIESNYQNKGILINKVFRDSDFSNVDINKRVTIFKMNGDIMNPEGIVATQNDYEKYTDSHRIMLMFFKRALISSTFLFIGYSFTDHLVLTCLSEITRYLGYTPNCHYAIMKNEPQNPYFEHRINDLECRYHIRVLLVKEYEDVKNVLKELNEKIRKKRVFISGAFSSSLPEVEGFSHELSRNLSSVLLGKDYRIVNGIGRRFGTHLIGYANEFLAKKGVKDIERYLIVKPFVGNKKSSEEDKKKLRKEVISQCGSAIFVFGDSNGNASNSQSGVWKEFKIARKQNKTIIPIAYPGMVSEAIWKNVKKHKTSYPYLEKRFKLLKYNQSSDKIAKVIVQILDSIQ